MCRRAPLQLLPGCRRVAEDRLGGWPGRSPNVVTRRQEAPSYSPGRAPLQSIRSATGASRDGHPAFREGDLGGSGADTEIRTQDLLFTNRKDEQIPTALDRGFDAPSDIAIAPFGDPVRRQRAHGALSSRCAAGIVGLRPHLSAGPPNALTSAAGWARSRTRSLKALPSD